MLFYNLRSMKFYKPEIIVRRKNMEKYDLKRIIDNNIQKVKDLWRSL